MMNNEIKNLQELNKMLDTQHQPTDTRIENRVTKNGVCKLFLHSTCPYKEKCPYSHDISKAQPCALYQENRCKFGATCDFSHQLGAPHIRNCKHIKLQGICENESCRYRHDLNLCAEYDQGYCPAGPGCPKAHIRKTLCMNYAYGFCPKGPKCSEAHPKVLTSFDEQFFKDMEYGLPVIRCHTCQRLGHKANNCPQKLTVEVEAVCLNCKKWHYKDNKCEQEDYLEGGAYFQAPIKLAQSKSKPIPIRKDANSNPLPPNTAESNSNPIPFAASDSLSNPIPLGSNIPDASQ